MEDYQKTSPPDLFYEAIHLSSTAGASSSSSSLTTTAAPFSDPTDEVVSLTTALQVKLKDVIVKKVPDAVRLAAGVGSTSAVVLEFNGADKFEGEFSYLFLLKGPRDAQQRDVLMARGFVPLLETLRHSLAPFEVRHSWVPGSNLNKLSLVWPVSV